MKQILKAVAHQENHSKIGWMRDVILGGQDGLVNVLGIVLGVAAASPDTKILIAASMAAAFAEAVSMAAVAYTSTLAQIDHYEKELQNEAEEIELEPEAETEELRQIYIRKGFEGQLLEDIVKTITADKDLWLTTLAREELNLEKIDRSLLLKISTIVGITALVAAFVPVFPFFFLAHNQAMIVSLITSCLALFAMGAYEAKIYVGSWFKNGMQIMAIGMGAALVGFLIGKVFRIN